MLHRRLVVALVAALVAAVTMSVAGQAAGPPGAKLVPSTAAGGENFGIGVARSGDTVVVGGHGANDWGGAAFVFVREAGSWVEQAELVMPSREAGDWFGIDVDVDGDTAVVGARNDNGGNGSAHVFVRTGSSWSHQASLFPDGTSGTDAFFGGEVAIAGDTIVVGASGESTREEVLRGAAYVFARTGTSWSQQAKLIPSDPDRAHVSYGESVGIDGDRIVVGGLNGDRAYVFERSGATWSETGVLDPPTITNAFGTSSAVSGDTVVVGDPRSPTGGGVGGAIYVFELDGGSWVQRQRIENPAPKSDDRFGQFVALDGDLLAVGAPGDDLSGLPDTGQSHIFRRAASTFELEESFVAPDATGGEGVGTVDVDADAVTVGAYQADAPDEDSGAAYVVGGFGAPPEAVNPLPDVAATEDDAPLVIDVSGVFEDPNGDPFTVDVTANDNPSVVDASLSGTDLTLTFLPDAFGAATIELAATDDGNLVGTDDFVVDVAPVNDLPIAVDDGPVTVPEGGTVFVPVLANDSDPDGDRLSPRIVSHPAHGWATVVGTEVRYVHDGSDQSATDAFTYQAGDGTTTSGVATVELAIAIANDPPVANPDAAKAPEGGSVTGNVLDNDKDDEGDPLTAMLAGKPTNGTVHLDPDGTFTYTHDGSEGTTRDTFRYRALDGTNQSEIAEVTVAIRPVNDPPVALDDGPFQTIDGLGFIYGSVLDNDTDAEGDPLAAVLDSRPGHGEVLFFEDGSFIYLHDGSAAAFDSFTYRADDGDARSNAATVDVEVEFLRPTVGLVDPTQGQWHLLNYRGQERRFFFGNPGDVPLMGDWDCDGVDTPGLYRQSDGYVYLRNENSSGVADISFFFGNPGDLPIAGDFDGDLCDTVSVYRPSQGQVFIINELGADNGQLGAAEKTYFFGNPGDKPFVGDFDGDAVDTIGLHRESTGLVYFNNEHRSRVADREFIFGDPGDRLVSGDWSEDGLETPALFRPSNSTFYFRHTNTQGPADAQFVFGRPGWIPVAGRFFLP